MGTSNPFPPYPGYASKLPRTEVINYFIKVKTEGTDVFSHGDGFIIPLDDIIVHVLPAHDEAWEIHYLRMGVKSTLGQARSLPELEKAMAMAASHTGKPWPVRPTTSRLSASTPASNLRSISDLIGASKIEAIFDPYLDNRALAILVDILSFGSGGVADVIRLLSSTRTTQGAIPRFTRSGVSSWLTELGIAGDARVVDGKDEHRRFLLLSGGQSLILGPSLNSIHKNEAAHIESDVSDRPFFDATWSAATPI